MREVLYVNNATEVDKLNMDKERLWDVGDRERTKRVPVPLL